MNLHDVNCTQFVLKEPVSNPQSHQMQSTSILPLSEAKHPCRDVDDRHSSFPTAIRQIHFPDATRHHHQALRAHPRKRRRPSIHQGGCEYHFHWTTPAPASASITRRILYRPPHHTATTTFPAPSVRPLSSSFHLRAYAYRVADSPAISNLALIECDCTIQLRIRTSQDSRNGLALGFAISCRKGTRARRQGIGPSIHNLNLNLDLKSILLALLLYDIQPIRRPRDPKVPRPLRHQVPAHRPGFITKTHRSILFLNIILALRPLLTFRFGLPRRSRNAHRGTPRRCSL